MLTLDLLHITLSIFCFFPLFRRGRRLRPSTCQSFLISHCYPHIRRPCCAPDSVMRLDSALAVLATVLPSLVQSSRLTPPVLPLIVRNPYLSTWLANARDLPWEKWPMFWTGQEVGFSVLASVPCGRTAYPLLGRPHDSLRREGDK